MREVSFSQLPPEARSEFVEAHRRAAERRLRAAEKRGADYSFIADTERRWLDIIARGEFESVIEKGSWKWRTDGEAYVGIQFDDRMAFFSGGEPEERRLEDADLAVWDGSSWAATVPWIDAPAPDRMQSAIIRAFFAGSKFGPNPHGSELKRMKDKGGFRN